MFKRPSLWIIVVVCVLGAGVAAAMLKKQNAPQTAAIAPTPAVLEFLASDLAIVQPHDLRRLLPLSGSLQQIDTVIIGS